MKKEKIGFMVVNKKYPKINFQDIYETKDGVILTEEEKWCKIRIIIL